MYEGSHFIVTGSHQYCRLQPYSMPNDPSPVQDTVPAGSYIVVWKQLSEIVAIQLLPFWQCLR